MSIFWMPCFLCNGNGRLETGDNYSTLSKPTYDECPTCKGKGQLAIKPYIKESWKKFRKDYL